jgi:ParB-like chromosome segregation protein Spo0J
MSGKVAFELKKIRLPLDVICPVRPLKNLYKKAKRYKMMVSSIQQMGLVEPLVVFPQKEGGGKYLLLEGHLRYAALKELNQTEAECIIATDDESFTYNARVNRMNAIQEHKMILKAVRKGVSAEKIAAALNVTVKNVRDSISLLDGINSEAADLLKDKPIAASAIALLKKVTGLRQIEIAEFMVSAGNYSKGYADALVMGTKKEDLVNPEEPKAKPGLTAAEIGKMEEEMMGLERDLKAVEEGYGDDMLNLACARSYVKKLLENGKVVRFLSANHSEILGQFEDIVAMERV